MFNNRIVQIVLVLAAILSIIIAVKTLTKGDCPCKKKDDELAPIDDD